MDCSYIQFSIYFYHSLKLFYLPKNQQVVILKIDFLPPISPISNEGCVINTQPTFRILSTLFISYLCRLSFLRIDILMCFQLPHHTSGLSRNLDDKFVVLPSIGE